MPLDASSDEVLFGALALLCEQGLSQYVEGWLLETLQVRLTTAVAPEFWTALKQPDGDLEERDRVTALLEAFKKLLQQLNPFLGKAHLPCVEAVYLYRFYFVILNQSVCFSYINKKI